MDREKENIRVRRFKAKHGGPAAYRNSLRDRSPEEYQKYLARKTVEAAIKSRKLTRQPCRCGNLKSHAHHNNYSKPLKVQWLCPKCHKAWHKKNPAI